MVKLNHYSINDDKNMYSQTDKIIESFGLKNIEYFDNSEFVKSISGEYEVYYKGEEKKRETDMTISCDGTVEKVGIFKDKIHLNDVELKCNQIPIKVDIPVYIYNDSYINEKKYLKMDTSTKKLSHTDIRNANFILRRPPNSENSNKNLKYGDKVCIQWAAMNNGGRSVDQSSGNTSNCGWYGCRILRPPDAVNAGLNPKFGHGTSDPPIFVLLAPPKVLLKEGTDIKVQSKLPIYNGSQFCLAYAGTLQNQLDEEIYSNFKDNCGWYGCRVLSDYLEKRPDLGEFGWTHGAGTNEANTKTKFPDGPTIFTIENDSPDTNFEAKMFIEKTHGENKYECLKMDGNNIVGHHYTNKDEYWGTIEYKRKEEYKCPDENCKNIDGGYAYGDNKRYTRGWALSNAAENSSVDKCKEICDQQPECKENGKVCKSTAYPNDNRCYCSVCSIDTTNETTTNETIDKTDETTDKTDETIDKTDETTDKTDETADKTDETTDKTDESLKLPDVASGISNMSLIAFLILIIIYFYKFKV
jgi:hypothetical protein